jgi:type VI secretion system protein ImpC
MMAAIDRKLSEQTNLIIHHPDFQQLESAWRGLNYLVYNTETDEMLKIRVLNISKKEIARTLKKFKGISWDQSPLFKKVYEEEYGLLGGEPFGCLIGDYYFSHSPQDVEILSGMGQIAAAAHAPFISAAAPEVMGMGSWQELANPRDLTKIFQTPEYASWRSLRASEDSRYLALTMPRYLGRLPYGAKTDPVDEFDFEEDTDGSDASRYLWCNSAYAMGVNMTRSFKLYGWLSRIRGVESGGLVEGLPTHIFPSDDGGVDMKIPTEVAIPDRREAELAKMGLIPLIFRKNTDRAAFIGAQSMFKPRAYQNNPEATAASNLSSRLPYMFATCRFAHYLKVIVRDWVGRYKEKEQLERDLNNWIADYIDGDPANSSELVKCQRPLAGAAIRIQENEENPGYYSAAIDLRPHFQLEGMDIGLRLVSRLKKG